MEKKAAVTGKFIIDFFRLRIGDILLTADDGSISRGIRAATRFGYSHAILYVGGGSYIHSDRDGVHAGNIQRLLLPKAEHGAVLRLKSDPTAEVLEKIVNYARLQIGKQYSIRSAVSSVSKARQNFVHEQNRQFCSRLVAQAYAFAGLPLVSNPNYASPRDIKKSGFVIGIDNCIRMASSEEIAIAASVNPLQTQSDTVNRILERIREELGADIQTIEQVAQFLFDNQQHDKSVTLIFEESGLLALWKYDLENNPWRYDFSLFLALPTTRRALLAGARFELMGGTEQRGRYLKIRDTYAEAIISAPLSHFIQMRDLYEELASLHQRRIDTARRVINALEDLN